MKRHYIILFLLSLVATQGVTIGEGFPKQVKKQIEERFKGPKGSRTYFVVLKPGIKATGNPVVLSLSSRPVHVATIIFRDNDIIDRGYDYYTHSLTVGTVLRLSSVSVGDSSVELEVATVDQFPIETTAGNMKKAVFENILKTELEFRFDEPNTGDNSAGIVFSEIDTWIKQFHSLEEARAFAESFPNSQEIRLGMTIEEVEYIFGNPERKALLGERTLYKYEDMVIEFLDGKVSDVQF